MSSYSTATKVGQLSEFQSEGIRAGTAPFVLDTIQHVYIKLDFQQQFENAKTADDANGFLRSVARAAMAVSQVSGRYGGYLLEIQGSMLHAGIPFKDTHLHDSRRNLIRECLGDIHAAFTELFGHSRTRVDGWRMTTDMGRTLVVSGRGVHGDSSWVSLGTSANRPAKHLFAQLELPEQQRDLKRFYVGFFDQDVGWTHQDLKSLPSTLNEARRIAKGVRDTEPRIVYSNLITASAAPIPSNGHPGAPSVKRPHTYFGWIMRTDLDGFTARVQACMDDDQKLAELAATFYRLMDAAAEFVLASNEELAQLPWAGDNFTAAAVFSQKSEYESAIPKQLVELTLDFEKEMEAVAKDCGFGGWAHSIASGEVHGNASGNIFIAGIEVENRRFLVAAGEGVGRSTQGFGDINPDAGEVVVYKADWDKLVDEYKNELGPAKTKRKQESSLYRLGDTRDLLIARTNEAAKEVVTVVTNPRRGEQPIRSRPYFKRR